MKEQLMQHLWPVAAMLGGVITHILKKAMKLSQLARNNPAIEKFNLKNYLAGHPYQTALTFIAGFGAYLTMMDEGAAVSLSASFLAGVAANSLGDIAPGDR